MFNQPLNFKNTSLTSGMPNMKNTLTGWESPLTLIKITQNVIDGDAQTQEEQINFLGCWQPLSAEKLQYKDVGERSWAWYWVHAKAGTLNLQTQDKIKFNGVTYKVMSVKDYSLNGFVEYEVIEDFKQNEQ